ncbi:MAG: hypothetical protein M3R44_07375 [Candidatus Eremiobacteraeota bacterium]|nr:hypothetical protein [Candidatus Eremiobacteraeota bacterium]
MNLPVGTMPPRAVADGTSRAATAATLAGPGYTLAILLCAAAPLAELPYVLRSGRIGLSFRAPWRSGATS